MLSGMPFSAVVIRLTVIALAVALPFSLSLPVTGTDDLSRGQYQAVFSIAISNESDPFDCDRLLCRYYNSVPNADFRPASFKPSFFWLRSDTRLAAEPRKLYQLNVVFLI
jgi:hypothetical protein